MTLYQKENPETIRQLFNHIAKRYDRTNAVLSFNMHKRWNRALIKHTLTASSPKVLLDLCCGTGEIAFAYLQNTNQPVKAYLLDFSEGMLAYASEKSQRLPLNQHEITYLHADAQSIPLPNESIDCVTIAYGIRNVQQPRKCIQDVHRVLQKNGLFGILELTQPKNSLLRAAHHLYLKRFLPLMGKMLTSNQEAYQYLCNSIPTFLPPQKIESLMVEAGFRMLKNKPLCFGAATLLVGQKRY